MEGEEDKRRGGEEAREWADRGPQGIWSLCEECQMTRKGFLGVSMGVKSIYVLPDHICTLKTSF